MAYYDYKVVPAPRRMKRARGINAHDELFALTLTEAINEHARQGWEYLRAETLSAETPGGWLRRRRLAEETVLVFRRERAALDPRLTPTEEPATPAAAARAAPAAAAYREEPARVLRREPRMEEPGFADGYPRDDQPVPHLGPAERG